MERGASGMTLVSVLRAQPKTCLCVVGSYFSVGSYVIRIPDLRFRGGSYFTKFLFYDSKRFYVAHTCQAGVAWHISQIWELILFSQDMFTHFSDLEAHTFQSGVCVQISKLGAHTFQSGVFAHISNLGAHTFQSGVTWPILQI